MTERESAANPATLKATQGQAKHKGEEENIGKQMAFRQGAKS